MKNINIKSGIWPLKTVLSCNLILFKYLLKPLSRRKELFLNKDTDLLIEGYPRCGNTFCVAAFHYFSRNKLNIARHRHEIGHIKLALSTGVPVVVVFRKPIEAISSFIVREKVNDKFAIHFYIKFNSFILDSFNKLLLFEFNDVVNNIQLLVDCVDKKFDLGLNVCETILDLSKIDNIVIEMEKMDSGSDKVRSTHVARPNKNREVLKKKVKERLIKQYPFLIEKANTLFNELRLKKNRIDSAV